jgi:hypothetical protein
MKTSDTIHAKAVSCVIGVTDPTMSRFLGIQSESAARAARHSAPQVVGLHGPLGAIHRPLDTRGRAVRPLGEGSGKRRGQVVDKT